MVTVGIVVFILYGSAIGLILGLYTRPNRLIIAGLIAGVVGLSLGALQDLGFKTFASSLGELMTLYTLTAILGVLVGRLMQHRLGITETSNQIDPNDRSESQLSREEH